MRKLALIVAALPTVVAAARNPLESDAVLAKAREKIAAVTHRLPRYTFLETINRDYLAVPASAIHGKVVSATPGRPVPQRWNILSAIWF